MLCYFSELITKAFIKVTKDGEYDEARKLMDRYKSLTRQDNRKVINRKYTTKYKNYMVTIIS